MPATLSKYILSAESSAVASSSFIAFYLLNRVLEARSKGRKRQIQADEEKALLAAGGSDKSMKADNKASKAYVDSVFFQRLHKLLKILVPRFFCRETFYLLLVAFSLIGRTWLDVWMISNGTLIESAIIGQSLDLFKMYLLRFIIMMPSISLINQLLKLGLSELKLRFRQRLTTHLIDKWLKGYVFYQLNNLDNRIANPDQLITQDVDKFCDGVTDLYSNLSKPILDIVIYAMKLTTTVGAKAPGFMVLYLLVTGLILTRLRRPLGRMTAREQQLEGEFRFVNSRIITSAEEVAFYRGHVAERGTLLSAFGRLVDHLRTCINFRFEMGLVDNIVAKYIATVVGYLVVSRPFLATDKYNLSSHAERLEDYYKSGRMLVRMAEAVGRVVLSGRELTRLSGFTARIEELDNVLDEVGAGNFTRGNFMEAPTYGQIVIADRLIKFEDVPLVTPTGDILVEKLNMEVKSGTNVIVCGPNGCGKSSLFRILGGLWPIRGGRLTKPADGKLFYIPQKPYMPLGRLRDQVIYPDTLDDMKKKRVTDDDLCKLLGHVQLGQILAREGGWDSVADWADVLSGGEKQRMAMARLFYHAPQFAILDECTSAVSVDVETELYAYCRRTGITLFTVSHRRSLWQHHEFFLHMDGRGSFQFGPITDATEQFGS